MSNIDKQDLIQRVDAALDTVRPHLKVDGGNVSVVDVTDDLIVLVKWLGNCQNCSMSVMTMKAGLEMALKTQVPEIKGVKAVNGVGVN